MGERGGGGGKAGISVFVRLSVWACLSYIKPPGRAPQQPAITKTLKSASALTHYREIHLELPQCTPPLSDSFFEAPKLQKRAASLQSNYTFQRGREEPKERERGGRQGGFSALINNRLINNTAGRKNTSDGEEGIQHQLGFYSFLFSFHVEYVMKALSDGEEFNSYLEMRVTRLMCLLVRRFY